MCHLLPQALLRANAPLHHAAARMQMLLSNLVLAEQLWYYVFFGGIALELPLCAFGSFRFLAIFSFAGCTSTVMVMLLVAALPALDPDRDFVIETAEHSWIRISLVPAMGIFAVRSPPCPCCLRPCSWLVLNAAAPVQLSVAGHSTFPSVRASMANPKDFPRALNIAYSLMATVLVAIAAVGYWYWGNLAHVLVTEDFQLHSPYSHINLAPSFGIHQAVQALVVLNVVTTLPLLVLSLQDLAHSFFAVEERWCHSSRPALVRPCR